MELNKERGIPLKVKIVSSRDSDNIVSLSKPLTTDFAAELKSTSNMSEKTLKNFIANFRKTYGRKSVETGIVETIRESTHILDDYFDQTYIESNCLVYCNKLNDFVGFILNHRDCSEEIIVKVGVDGGAGSLKICLAIQDCLSPSNNLKDSGVKKMFILAIAFGVPESYENIKIMFEKLDLNNFFSIMSYNDNVVLVGDMKIINLILGIFEIFIVEHLLNLFLYTGLMSNSAKHFCAWCTTTLENRGALGESRTIVSIKTNYNNWCNEKLRDKKSAILYKNCINEPLIVFNAYAPIINFIPPPELHILIGIVTHLYSKLESENPEVADKWLKSSQLKFFHG